jgi:hypothetical protein
MGTAKPRISVILPTRGRTGLLNRMLESLVMTADDPSRVEVVLRVDDDDTETLVYLHEQARTTWATMLHRLFCVTGPRLNGYASTPTFINEAAAAATADLLLLNNDDVAFHTHGWDRRLVEEAAKYPDGIFDLCVDSVVNNPNCVFPCQSRRQMDLLGGFCDQRLIYIDIWLRDVLAPFGRVIRVDDVRIEHQWTGRTPDQERALHDIVCTGAYDQLYTQCVTEGRARIASVLQAVAS